MAEMNELIIQKLLQYDPDVFELALEALKFAQTLSEQSVAEQLEGIVRQIIRKRGVQE